MSTILAEDQTPATTLLVLRVGRYQMFEETFGLTVGSDLISQIKSKVGQLLRDSDVLVQVAADEFLVLLDQVSQSNRVVEITTRLIAECTYVQIHGQEHIPINIDDVARAVRGAGIQYAEIKLEIVESKAIDSNSRASDALGELRSRGVLIAVGDFGTGCSSLSSLTQLPVDVIKVDRSFMLQTPFNQQARGIVSALFCLAQELGLQVTVEGVETDEQEQFLKDLGCESAQGFGYAKPMCADDLWDFYQLNH